MSSWVQHSTSISSLTEARSSGDATTNVMRNWVIAFVFPQKWFKYTVSGLKQMFISMFK